MSTKLAQKICIHGTPSEICAIARAAIHAGLSDHQSILLARVALEISKNNGGHDVESVAKGIVRQARIEHSETYPNGKWAELIHRYADWRYMSEDEPRARAWSTPLLDSSYNIKEAQS